MIDNHSTHNSHHSHCSNVTIDNFIMTDDNNNIGSSLSLSSLSSMTAIAMERNNLGVLFLNNGDFASAQTILFQSLQLLLKAAEDLPLRTSEAATGEAERLCPSFPSNEVLDHILLLSCPCSAPPRISPPSPCSNTTSDTAATSTTTSRRRMAVGARPNGRSGAFPEQTHEELRAEIGVHLYFNGLELWTCFSQDRTIHLTLCAAIIVFNLAVVSHVGAALAKHQGRAHPHHHHHEGQHLLPPYCSHPNARLLYEKCYVILTSAGVSISSGWTGNAPIDMLSMALLNNLAHICFELGEYLQSSKYYEQLIQLTGNLSPPLSELRSSISSSSSSTTPTMRYGDFWVETFMHQQKHIFLLNAMLLCRPPTLAPAA